MTRVNTVAKPYNVTDMKPYIEYNPKIVIYTLSCQMEAFAAAWEAQESGMEEQTAPVAMKEAEPDLTDIATISSWAAMVKDREIERDREEQAKRK
jgi:hypothetical protein